MDRVSKYRQIVKKVLTDYVEYISGSPSETQDILVFDDNSNVYTAFGLGWSNNRRVQIMPVLMRVVDSKIYVEDDNTDYGFVDYLLKEGVPASDIVLAWHPPHMRQYTEFAVA